ncbi:MAG: hypothetical protein KGH71_00765 [Candidatus Micrarchaeota archaeon]|nr:hypothetical protein [Candidatus Micrarchaeota archaeon]
MNKRIILIGIIVMVASFVIGAIALPNALMGISNFSNQSISLLPAHNTYLPYFINETGFIVLGYQSSQNLNFYFANASAFLILQNYMNSTLTLSQWATRLQGNGVLESIPNSKIGIFPYSQFSSSNAAPQGSYIVENASILPAGNYYAIFQNTGNSSATVNVTSNVSTNISSKGGYIFGIGILIFVLFVAGIIIIVYGIVKRPKIAPEQETSQQKVDELYKGVGRGKGKAKK